eukprot:gene36871-44732_t
MLGYDLFSKSINGIRTVVADDVQSTTATYATLSANRLSAGELISDLTQMGARTIQQSGTSSNLLKDTTVSNLTLSGSLTSNLIQSAGNVISQSGSGVNALKSSQLNGTLTCNGGIVQISGTNNLNSILMPAQQVITQQGSGTGANSQNTMRTILQPTNGHVITQGGNGVNTLKQTNFIAPVAIAGNLTQTSGNSTLLDLSCGNITQSNNSSILQSGSGIANAFGSSTVSNLVVTSTMTFPSSITIPSGTVSGDQVFSSGRIVQDLTQTDINQLKTTNFRSITLEGSAALKTVTADSLDVKAFNLLDSGGAVIVSDGELRFLDGVTSNIQTQISANATAISTAQTDIASIQTVNSTQQTQISANATAISTAQTDIASIQTVNSTQQTQISANATAISTAQTDIASIQTVNTAQQTQIDNLNTHVASAAVTLSGDQTVSGNKRFVNLRAEAFNLIDTTGSIVVSDARFRMLSTLSSNVQSQLDALASVNATQTADIASLRSDHDGHVSNAVTLTGNQTIGGAKTFSLPLSTTGISNNTGIATFGSSTAIHPSKQSPATSLSYALGTTNLLASTVTIYGRTQYTIDWAIPINLCTRIDYAGFSGSIASTDTITAINYTILDETDATVGSGAAFFNRSLPLVYTHNFSVPAMGIIAPYWVRMQSGTAFVRWTPSFSSSDKTYRLLITMAGSLSFTPSSGSFLSAVRGYEVNSSLFPISSPSAPRQGTYHSFDIGLTILGYSTNLPTAFTPGSLVAKFFSPFTDGDILTADVGCNELVANRIRVRQHSWLPSFIPCMLLGGTVFSNANDQTITQNWDAYNIPCSMQRLARQNDDRAIVLNPGYSIELFKGTSYTSSWTRVENLSNEIATVRTNRLNNSTLASYINGHWQSLAAAGSGSYGQNQSSSVRLYYGSFTDGTQVEIASSLFS